MKEKNIESSLIDFAATAQPTLLLMSDDGITKQWRLNYNVAETQVPFLSNEQQENQMLTTQYRCNYIPRVFN